MKSIDDRSTNKLNEQSFWLSKSSLIRFLLEQFEQDDVREWKFLKHRSIIFISFLIEIVQTDLISVSIVSSIMVLFSKIFDVVNRISKSMKDEQICPWRKFRIDN